MLASRRLISLVLFLIAATAAASDSIPPSPQAEADSVIHVISVHMDDAGVTLEGEGKVIHISGEVGPDDEASRVKIRRVHECEHGDGQFFFQEDVTIGADELIKDDMVVMFGDLDVYGRLSGDVVVVKGDLYVHDGGEIIGDAVCLGGEVLSDSTALLHGEVVSIPFGALFTGKAWNVLVNLGGGGDCDKFDVVLTPRSPVSRMAEAVGKLLGLLIVGLLTLLIFRKRVAGAAAGLKLHPWKSLLYGFLSLLAGALLFIPVVLTLVLVLAFLAVILSPLVPLMLIVVVAYVLSIVLIIMGIFLIPGLIPIMAFSRYSWEKRGMNAFASATLWLLIAWAFWTLTDLVGGFAAGLGNMVRVVFFLTGLGAILMTRLGTRNPEEVSPAAPASPPAAPAPPPALEAPEES